MLLSVLGGNCFASHSVTDLVYANGVIATPPSLSACLYLLCLFPHLTRATHQILANSSAEICLLSFWCLQSWQFPFLNWFWHKIICVVYFFFTQAEYIIIQLNTSSLKCIKLWAVKLYPGTSSDYLSLLKKINKECTRRTTTEIGSESQGFFLN